MSYRDQKDIIFIILSFCFEFCSFICCCSCMRQSARTFDFLTFSLSFHLQDHFDHQTQRMSSASMPLGTASAVTTSSTTTKKVDAMSMKRLATGLRA